MPVTIHVYPNPYAALDADGAPAGAFPLHDAVGQYVAARLVQDKADPPVADLMNGAPTAKRRFVFDLEHAPVAVPANAHYLYALRTGELLPADERTARECGVRWTPLREALAAAKARACAAYLETTGVDAACMGEPLMAPPVPADTATAPASPKASRAKRDEENAQ